jgi:hypothetical protein
MTSRGVRKMSGTVVVTQDWHHTLREVVRAPALAALERQAQREELTLGELVGCVLEKVASQLLIQESMHSIELGTLCDDSLTIEKGFDIGGSD